MIIGFIVYLILEHFWPSASRRLDGEYSDKKENESMQILNEQDIINVMNGAALLAAGGGGCFDDGMILLESFKKNHPDKPEGSKLFRGV